MFSVTSGPQTEPLKVVVYGPGGVGKSELCAAIKQLDTRPLVLDVGDSTARIDVDRISGIGSFNELRAILHDESIWANRGAVIIDDLTKAQEMAVDWTVDNIKTEKGKSVSSIEGYGYGKGYVHLLETFMLLLGDLDAHHRKGRHILCTAHECTAKVPNPSGEDWIRYEPRLSRTDSSSVRLRVKEWCYHLLFIGYDAAVEEGKATGSGTRTIFTTEMPTHMAKKREFPGQEIPDQLTYERNSAEIWKTILNLQ